MVNVIKHGDDYDIVHQSISSVEQNIDHESLEPSNYNKIETSSIVLDNTFIYNGLTYIPEKNELILGYTTENNENYLEFRRIDNGILIRTIFLEFDHAGKIEDLIWCVSRNELLLINTGHLIAYNIDNELITSNILIDVDKATCRIGCNSKFICCVDGRALKLYDINNFKLIKNRRLDHVVEGITFDDEYFISGHTGKLEFLDKTLFSIRRFPIGGTRICRFNKKYWLICDDFDDRLLWYTLDKLVHTVNNVHQPKGIVVIKSLSRIIIQCNDPNRLIIFDPNIF
ncbi:unnamed protein product [Didymodactylos carnosus]|uniref:Uncharacterized protein n=1 Tax=Didymodactylos carnosus TaxID=1234261 RepID=A0A813RTB0_9BILA|nr:unnamed protein product [Didymodactylos carnosus]CAF3570297.1 unnamed protein product [Didymodactylos carnosus]